MAVQAGQHRSCQRQVGGVDQPGTGKDGGKQLSAVLEPAGEWRLPQGGAVQQRSQISKALAIHMIGVGRARVYRRFSSHPADSDPADSECFSVGDG